MKRQLLSSLFALGISAAALAIPDVTNYVEELQNQGYTVHEIRVKPDGTLVIKATAEGVLRELKLNADATEVVSDETRARPEGEDGGRENAKEVDANGNGFPDVAEDHAKRPEHVVNGDKPRGKPVGVGRGDDDDSGSESDDDDRDDDSKEPDGGKDKDRPKDKGDKAPNGPKEGKGPKGPKEGKGPKKDKD